MNKHNAKDYLPFVQALVDGKTIQSISVDGRDWIDIDKLSFSFSPSYYRIKPEPKLRPWRPEEVPVGALIREHCYGVRVIQGYGPCLAIHDDCNYKYVQYLDDHGRLTGDSLETCFNRCEYSLDLGKTWLPCGVVEE